MLNISAGQMTGQLFASKTPINSLRKCCLATLSTTIFIRLSDSLTCTISKRRRQVTDTKPIVMKCFEKENRKLFILFLGLMIIEKISDLLKKIHRNGLPSNLPSNLTSNLPQNIPVAKSDARNIETYAKELVQENLQYKRTQKELSMRLGMVDRTTLEVKIKAQSLCIESHKQE